MSDALEIAQKIIRWRKDGMDCTVDSEILADAVVKLTDENSRENFRNQQGGDALIMATEMLAKCNEKLLDQSQAIREAEEILTGAEFRDDVRKWLKKYGTKK